MKVSDGLTNSGQMVIFLMVFISWIVFGKVGAGIIAFVYLCLLAFIHPLGTLKGKPLIVGEAPERVVEVPSKPEGD